jgi:DNA-binding NtrC family response regulator
VGNRAAIPGGDGLTIGREASWLGAGVLADPRISRQHARIVLRGGSPVVLDLGSRNGTFVDGARVSEAALRPGAVLSVGPVLLLVHLASATQLPPRHPTLIGRSSELATLLTELDRVARTPSAVLVQGETGTGKELVAREIHNRSGRKGPFVAINCGGLPDSLLADELFGHARGAFTGADKDRVGLVEASSGGTLFLDEIGDASAGLQVSLLRVLQEGEVRRLGSTQSVRVDLRVCAATHVDLAQAVASGRFREDLYARLSRWVLQVPALRQRPDDIPHLVAHFAKRFSGRSVPITQALAQSFFLHPWPRNVRELEAAVERALIEQGAGGPLDKTAALEKWFSAPSSAAPPGAPPKAERQTAAASKRGERPSREELERLLTQQGGNIRQVAAALGSSRNSVYRWMQSYDLTPAPHRHE